MKKIFSLALLLLLNVANLFSQIPLIGENAPSFTAETTKGILNFPTDYGSSWKIIFSHPRDFTPVCSSEILTLSQMQSDFNKLDVKLVIVSTDDLQKHLLWKKSLEDVVYKNKKPVKIDFPLVDDSQLSISKSYGMLHKTISTTKDVRGVFIVNPDDKIAAIFYYPMNIGRNMEEIKRTIIALQTSGTGKNSVSTPANWQLGDDVLVPHFPYTEKELQKNPNLASNYYNVGSFMWFKKQ